MPPDYFLYCLGYYDLECAKSPTYRETEKSLMNKTLKSLSLELCKPVLDGLKHTPKSHALLNAYGKTSMITAMHHVMGFDGEKLERVKTISDESLRKYMFLLIRPFYHSLHVTMFVNTGKQWEVFGRVTRTKVEFEKTYRAIAFKTISNMGVWRNTIQATGITNLKPPTTDVLPNITNMIKKFGDAMQHGKIGPFAVSLLDGMSRASDVNTYVRAMMSIMHFEIKIHADKVVIRSDIEGSTIDIQITEHAGTPPTPKALRSNAFISEKLKNIREVRVDEYGPFFDIVMLRALKNTIVIIPFDDYVPHSIQYEEVNFDDAASQVIVDSYVVAKDNRSHFRINATIEVNK